MFVLSLVHSDFLLYSGVVSIALDAYILDLVLLRVENFSYMYGGAFFSWKINKIIGLYFY